MTNPQSDRGGRPDGDALLGVTEVAHRLGVKPNTVIIWRRRHEDFPGPLADLSMGPVWWAADIDAWAAARTLE